MLTFALKTVKKFFCYFWGKSLHYLTIEKFIFRIDFLSFIGYNKGMKKTIIFEINGKRPLDDWMESLKDKKTIARISERIGRLMTGYYGDFKRIDNELSELRLKFGAGYRIYFSERNNVIILLLCGGDKSTQSKDIKKAKEYLQIWKGNNND